MSEAEETREPQNRDWKRIAVVGLLILLAAIFSFLNADERIAINVGFTVLYRLSLVGVVFTVFLLGMLTMFLFGLRHDRVVRDALRTQLYRQPLQGRPLTDPLPVRTFPVVVDGPDVTNEAPPSFQSDAALPPRVEESIPDDSPEPEPPA